MGKDETKGCGTCEYETESSQEHCATCEGISDPSRWKEAGWVKDKKIAQLEKELGEAREKIKKMNERYCSCGYCADMDSVLADSQQSNERLKEANSNANKIIACDADEKDKLYKENERLKAEVERLKEKHDNLFQIGIQNSLKSKSLQSKLDDSGKKGYVEGSIYLDALSKLNLAKDALEHFKKRLLDMKNVIIKTFGDRRSYERFDEDLAIIESALSKLEDTKLKEALDSADDLHNLGEKLNETPKGK